VGKKTQFGDRWRQVMPLDTKAIVADIDVIIAEYRAMRKASRHEDCSDQDDVKITAMITGLSSAIDRFSAPGSRYLKAQEGILAKYGPISAIALAPLAGVLSALREDIAAGRLASVVELLHADVFGDFLDMAGHLLDEGYKDAAAVLTGGVLEEHLRKLCGKHGLSNITTAGKPKKADTLNSELAALTAYSKLDQKNVTAWLGLRNDAAHGNYGAYTQEQAVLLVQAVRDFITRVPA